MKTGKRMISFLLACLMLFTAAPQVFAETFDVESAEDWVNDWNTASENYDSSNTFNVTNDIDMQGHTLYAENNKTYIVNNSGDHIIQHVGIVNNSGNGNSDVIINSDIVGTKEPALTVIDGSVTVNGNVTTVAEEDAITALDASANAQVFVDGDVGSAVAGGSENQDKYAVTVGTGAKVVISGDVFSAEKGVNVILDASLVVAHDIDAAGGAMKVDGAQLSVNGNVESGGSSDIIDSEVRVKGDFTMDGILNVIDSTVYVGGISDGGEVLKAEQVHISNNSNVVADTVEADRVTVGAMSFDTSDDSTLTTNSITNESSDSTLKTDRNAYVQVVTGNVDNVIAAGNSVVDIYGFADSVVKKDNAEVNVNLGGKPAPAPTPAPAPAPSVKPEASVPPTVPAIPDDSLIELCQGYQQGSDLHNHVQSLGSLEDQLRRDVDELNTVQNALLAQILLTTKLDLTSLGSGISFDSLDTSLYHPDSIAAVKERHSTREITQRGMTYTVDCIDIDSSIMGMYKKQLATSLANASEAIGKNAYNQSLAALSMNTALELLNLKEGPANGLIGGNKTLTIAGLLTIPAFKALSEIEQKKVFEDIKTIVDTIDATQTLGNISDKNIPVVNAILTSAEFLEYWMRNYSCQIAVLDNLLKEQPMNAEMFYAAASLRDEYADKVSGTVTKILNAAIKLGHSAAMKKIPGGAAAEAILSLISVSPIVTKQEKLVDGVASGRVLNQASDAYQAAIQKVKNGDHSEEAIDMVHMTFSMYKTTMETMCDTMIAYGDSQQVNYYTTMKANLQNLKIGQILAAA